MNASIRLIVGLGNPGSEYFGTRHNAGAHFVNELSQRQHLALTANGKFFGLCGRVFIASKDVRLLIPTTFMNLSGKAVAAMARFYNIPPESILIVHDELDLPPGTARLKIGGGHGGHNGLRDSIKALANDKSFARLRIGIGHPGSAKQVSHYVLQKPLASEQQKIMASIDNALTVLPLVVAGEWDQAMQKLHSVNNMAVT